MTPNSTEERVALKACVRCGRTPTITERDVEPQGDPWYGQKIERFVLCECGMCLFDEYFHDGFVSDEDAIAAWNTRTDNDVSGLVEALEEANANLIAAAPAMYEACALLDAFLYATAPESNEAQIVRAALKQARGE